MRVSASAALERPESRGQCALHSMSGAKSHQEDLERAASPSRLTSRATSQPWIILLFLLIAALLLLLAQPASADSNYAPGRFWNVPNFYSYAYEWQYSHIRYDDPSSAFSAPSQTGRG